MYRKTSSLGQAVAHTSRAWWILFLKINGARYVNITFFLSSFQKDWHSPLLQLHNTPCYSSHVMFTLDRRINSLINTSVHTKISSRNKRISSFGKKRELTLWFNGESDDCRWRWGDIVANVRWIETAGGSFQCVVACLLSQGLWSWKRSICSPVETIAGVCRQRETVVLGRYEKQTESQQYGWESRVNHEISHFGSGRRRYLTLRKALPKNIWAKVGQCFHRHITDIADMYQSNQ